VAEVITRAPMLVLVQTKKTEFLSYHDNIQIIKDFISQETRKIRGIHTWLSLTLKKGLNHASLAHATPNNPGQEFHFNSVEILRLVE